MIISKKIGCHPSTLILNNLNFLNKEVYTILPFPSQATFMIVKTFQDFKLSTISIIFSITFHKATDS